MFFFYLSIIYDNLSIIKLIYIYIYIYMATGRKQKLWIKTYIYIYIYMYMCVCVCVCVCSLTLADYQIIHRNTLRLFWTPRICVRHISKTLILPLAWPMMFGKYILRSTLLSNLYKQWDFRQMTWIVFLQIWASKCKTFKALINL